MNVESILSSLCMTYSMHDFDLSSGLAFICLFVYFVLLQRWPNLIFLWDNILTVAAEVGGGTGGR